jgi:hypothetical protein
MSDPANSGNDRPLVDDATFATWKAEARACPPDPDDWAHFVAMLRLSAAIDSDASNNPDEPGASIVPSMCAMRAIVSFLQGHPHLDEHGEAVAPLNRLSAALNDLSEGRMPPMFKPVRIPGVPGAPGNRMAVETIKGLAARTVSELCESGMSLTEASRAVCVALQRASERERGMQDSPSQKGFGKITPATVKNWRARIMEGSGPGASKAAVWQYNQPLPLGVGLTPQQRSQNLLKVLRERAASMI